MAKGDPKSEVLQGTLDLMILKTLDAMGPLHGYGIARRIEQLSEDILQLNEGTVYTSLLRLQQQGWISSNWGASENNRKAKFYAITKSGRRQLVEETENWERIARTAGEALRILSSHQFQADIRCPLLRRMSYLAISNMTNAATRAQAMVPHLMRATNPS